MTKEMDLQAKNLRFVILDNIVKNESANRSHTYDMYGILFRYNGE